MTGTIQKRNPLIMLLLLIVTLGIYYFYWLYKSKEEINSLGAKIPTFWFAVIPVFHIYFAYRYAQEFVKYINKEDRVSDQLAYFIILLLPFISMFIIQYELNHYEDKKS